MPSQYIAVAKGGRGQKEAIAPDAQKYIFKKKIASFFLFFCQEPCSGRLQQPFRGQQCPPLPPRRVQCSLLDKFLDHT